MQASAGTGGILLTRSLSGKENDNDVMARDSQEK
jgi:hypothetical protein